MKYWEDDISFESLAGDRIYVAGTSGVFGEKKTNPKAFLPLSQAWNGFNKLKPGGSLLKGGGVPVNAHVKGRL